MKRKGEPATPLTAADERLLRFGTDAPMPTQQKHDELRALWRVHGDWITATMPAGEKPWFVDRDYFVKLVRGEIR